MNAIQRFYSTLQGLEPQQLYRALALFFGGVLALIAIWWYVSSWIIDGLEQKLKALNKQRQITRTLLERHQIVKQQQSYVNAILSQDPAFRIIEYFNKLMQEQGLASFNNKPPTIIEEDLGNGYQEIRIDVGFTNINTKQLCELLLKLEQNERIFTKELVVTKALKSPTIDVSIVLGTLQPKTT